MSFSLNHSAKLFLVEFMYLVHVATDTVHYSKKTGKQRSKGIQAVYKMPSAKVCGGEGSNTLIHNYNTMQHNDCHSLTVAEHDGSPEFFTALVQFLRELGSLFPGP